MNINQLRWKTLELTGMSYKYIKNHIKNKYGIEVEENNINEFLLVVCNKYPLFNEQDVLFELEDIGYKKVAVFYLRDKEKEVLINPTFKEIFLTDNRLKGFIDRREVKDVDIVLYPCYISFSNDYVTIKMAQKREYIDVEIDSDNTVSDINNSYYHCVKFVIDTNKGLVFMFYNDIITEGEDSSKRKAITEKKQALYCLFPEGNQNTLLKFSFDKYLNSYIKEYLERLDNDENYEQKSVIVIETEDPIQSGNNLRSSKKDGRHNKYRLAAIKYALEHEEHTVKCMECEINKIWFQLRNQGEISINRPYISREVVESVCKEIFPNYEFFRGEFK